MSVIGVIGTSVVICTSVAALLIGCAGNNNNYELAIPIADAGQAFTVRTGQQRFEIRYQKDVDGNIATQQVTGHGQYIGGGRESYDAVYEEARKRMIRNAIDQVNGVFISAKTEVVRKNWNNGEQSSGYEDIKDETISKLFGTAKVMGGPHCSREPSDPGTTKISCDGRVSVPVIDIIITQL